MRVKDTEAIGAAVGPRGRVKICGITRSEDGILAARLGADAVGLVFHPKSPRVVGVERARAIVAAHPPCRELVIPGPSRIPCAGCGPYVAERVGARGKGRHDWVGEQP